MRKIGKCVLLINTKLTLNFVVTYVSSLIFFIEEL